MKKKSKASKKQNVVLGPPTSRREYLETLIKLSKTAISDPPHESEQHMIDQVDRLTKELKGLKK